jgi:hypothetical protein
MPVTSRARLRQLLSLGLLLGAGIAVVPVGAQSLADVARKEEERRKAVPAPARVYTNKDLTAVPAGSVPPPPAASSTPAKPADAAAKEAEKDAKDKEPAKDKAYWALRRKTLQDKLDRDQSYADAMQTRINSLTADAVNRDDPAQRSMLERDRQKSLADLARLKQDIANGKKALTDLDEEARRAGVPPGWLR